MVNQPQNNEQGNHERLGKIRQQLEYNVDIQRVVMSVLRLSLEISSLDELLDRTLALILSIPELSLGNRGGIYLIDEKTGRLCLRAHAGLSETARHQCQEAHFSDFCGMTAQSRDILFVRCRSRHLVSGGDPEEHAHYCIPILFNEEHLGLIHLIVPANHKDAGEERNFLKSVADTLGAVVRRKQAESKLFEDRMVLEKEVKERSEDLLDLNQNLLLEVQQHQRSRQALLRAQKDLEETLDHLKNANQKLREASRRKTEFISFVAHELRTPLTAIRNAASVLSKKNRALVETDRSAKQMLEIIVGNVDRQMKTLLDLLDISRMESGALVLHKEDFDIVRLIETTLESFDSQARQKGIQVTFWPRGSRISVFADAEYIRRVFNNLVSNAVKFTPLDGQVSVRVEKNGPDVSVRVSDTGVGIQERDLEKIFQKSGKGEISQGSAEGRGLGLSIARGIIELHGGTIRGESLPGQGSMFMFTIPASQVLASKKRILIIEDEKDIAQTLQEAFRGEGFEALMSVDGKDGLKRARTEHPDAITLNLKLPEISGEEVCRELRKDPQTQKIPIVMVTAKSTDVDKVVGRVIGADYYFAKPSDPYEIVSKVKSLMEVGR